MKINKLASLRLGGKLVQIQGAWTHLMFSPDPEGTNCLCFKKLRVITIALGDMNSSVQRGFTVLMPCEWEVKLKMVIIQVTGEPVWKAKNKFPIFSIHVTEDKSFTCCTVTHWPSFNYHQWLKLSGNTCERKKSSAIKSTWLCAMSQIYDVQYNNTLKFNYLTT